MKLTVAAVFAKTGPGYLVQKNIFLFLVCGEIGRIYFYHLVQASEAEDL